MSIASKIMISKLITKVLGAVALVATIASAQAPVPPGTPPAGTTTPGASPPASAAPVEKLPWQPLPSPVSDEYEDVFLIRVKRAITVSGEAIDDATIVVRGGKITAIGKLVDAPKGAKLLDYRECIATPGMVSAFSKAAYAPKGPVQGAQTKAREWIDASAEILKRASAAGVTTLGIVPSGTGIYGYASAIRTRGRSLDDMVLRDDSYLVSLFDMGTAGKDTFRKTLQHAKDEMERFEKAQKEAAEKPATPPASAPGSAPASAPATGAPPPPPAAGGAPPVAPAKPSGPPKLDPKLEPIVRVLKKERRLLTQFQGSGGFGGNAAAQPGPAAEILHFQEAVKKFDFDKIYICGPQSLNLLDKIVESKAFVLLPTEENAFENFTRYRVNAASEFTKAGIQLALLPPVNPVGADLQEGFENWMFKVGQLVRLGLSEKVAFRSVTLTPAEILGVQDRVGALEAGKDADLLFFNGHPFDASTKLVHVMVGGTLVPESEL